MDEKDLEILEVQTAETAPETVEDPAEKKEEKKPEPPEGNAVTRLYDKLPFSFKQMDIFVKVLAVGLILVLIYGYLTGTYSPLK